MSAPAIRFPDEAHDWLETPFDEACRTVSTRGYQLQTNAFATSGELPVVDQGASLIAGYTDNHELRFDNVPVIVFGDHTTNLKFIDFPFVVGADGTKLIQPVDADARFLYYSLIKNNVEQEGYKRHFSILREKVLSLPSLPEQRRIADALSAVDAKIDLLGRKRDALSRFKAGLMHKLFSQEVRFTRDDGSAYPDWHTTTLSDVVTFSKGKGISKAEIDPQGTVPCVRYGELYTTYGDYIDDVVSRTSLDPSNLRLSLGGEVIIPASGETAIDIATASVVIQPGVALGGDLNILTTDQNGHFLAAYISSHKRSELASKAQGNSVVHLYPTHLRGIGVEIPCLDEQHRISATLRDLDTKVGLLNRQITTIQAFKKGLLQQMFV